MVSAVLILGLLGIIASIGLGIASKKFAVEVDPKVEEINEVLPQANCGGCGYPGCINFAEAVAKGEADPGGCVVGGDEVANKVAKIIGVEVSTSIRKIAVVRCSGTKDKCGEKFVYSGVKDCRAANSIAGGFKNCAYGCLGLGSCVNVCPFNAIKIGENGLPVVNEDLCTGCGNCVKVCPRGIIILVPVNKKVRVLCVSKDKGNITRKICIAGCIACGRCERVCPVNAVKVIDNHSEIDFEKCLNCGLCAKVCPQKVIHDFNDETKPKAFIIEEKCVGCGKCAKICPVNAISGEIKKVHFVNEDKCIGCSLCINNCPKNAIELLQGV